MKCSVCNRPVDEPVRDDYQQPYCQDCAAQVRKDAPEMFLGEWA